MSETKLAIDLYCGLGGWAEGFLAEGFKVTGFDIERHDYGTGGYPGQLVIQDVTTLQGSQFRNAAVIVASPPCQAYSYRAMPWSRAKALPPPNNTLFEACFRIQREASEAAGRHIPLIVENVRGAQKWVGRAKWHFGSYYLWGDVPALMPITLGRTVMKAGVTHRADGATNFHGQKVPPIPTHPRSDFGWNHSEELHCARTESASRHLTNQAESVAVMEGVKEGGDWWNKECRKTGMAQFGSKSSSRKAASAMIAKIPFALSNHIAKCVAAEGRMSNFIP